MRSHRRLELEIQVLCRLSPRVQRVVDVVVVDGVVGVVQAVLVPPGGSRGPVTLDTTRGPVATVPRHVVPQDGLVQVAGLQGAPHRHVPVEGQVDRLRQEVS